MASHVYEAMRPYQRTGAHFARRNGSVLLADQPGLGKTIQTLGGIIATSAMESGPRTPEGYHLAHERVRWHLILCPSVAVNRVWGAEAALWLPDHPSECLALTGTLAERQAAIVGFVPRPETRHVFVVANIESVRIKPAEDTFPKSLRKHQIIRFKQKRKPMAYHPDNAVLPALFDRVWDTVICDESHRALIRTAHIPTQTRAGFMLLASRRRVALSGTPMRGKPEQLWGTLNWLRPDLYTSFWKWCKTYFAVTQDQWGWQIGGLTESGKSRLAADLDGIMLRRTKAEVAPDLPPKTYAGWHLIDGDEHSPLGVWFTMEPNQGGQYDTLVTEGLFCEEPVNNPLTDYLRQRQVAGCFWDNGLPQVGDSPKFNWLVEWLGENEEKIIVVSQFTSVLAAYEAELLARDYDVVSITGRISPKARDNAVERFQNGEAQVMLLNLTAGGVALTLDAADYVAFLDESSIPDETEQAEDRAHRISRLHNVTIYFLRTLGTIEEEVAYIAAARQDVQQYLLDGARGVEYARQVYLTSRDDAAKNPTTKESQFA